jgi:uncharacterized membrane protein YphA (DoxX/SURF4 family)
MNGAFTLGRILLVVIFIISGALKLLDIAGTADMIQSKLVIPSVLTDVTSQIEATLGMPIWQILAIVVALIELLGGLLIAFNVLTRTMAVVLLLFVAVTTFYFHDFWNQSPPDNAKTLIEALKNLSLIGGLFIIAGYGKGPRSVEPAYGDV